MRVQEEAVCCVAITPFNKDGSLDEGALRAHLRWVGAAGCSVYPASTGTGEGHQLQERETLRVFEIAVEELKGKVPIYAGLGYTDTDSMVQQAKTALAIGVDAIELHGPRPGPPGLQPAASREELERYYKDVLEGIAGSVVLSVNLFVVPVDIPIELIVRLVEQYPSIKGISQSFHSNPTFLMRLIDALGGKAPVSCGTGQLLNGLCLGARGIISLEPNVAPRLCNTVVQSYRSGEYARALQAYSLLAHVSAIILKYGNPRTVKAAMRALGLPGGGEMRRPYLPLGKAVEEELARELDRLDIRAIEGIA